MTRRKLREKILNWENTVKRSIAKRGCIRDIGTDWQAERKRETR